MKESYLMEKYRVLFLCTGNTARSQIGEAWLRKYAGNQIDVYSAGLEPGVIHPLTIRVMEEAGIDMSNHRSKPFTEYLGKVHLADNYRLLTFGYLIYTKMPYASETRAPIPTENGAPAHSAT